LKNVVLQDAKTVAPLWQVLCIRCSHSLRSKIWLLVCIVQPGDKASAEPSTDNVG